MTNSLFKIQLNAEELTNLTWKINREDSNSIALVCRGNRMKRWRSFSDEISAVLQFPEYFNVNANSLYECIRDLEWIYREKIFVFIRDSNLILSEEPGDFLYFFEDSTKVVPVYSEQFLKTKKHVYYIFQNIDKDFPIFKEEDYLNISHE